VTESRESLELYREQVVAELTRRTEVFKRVEAELGAIQFALEKMGRSGGTLLGDTYRAATRWAYRASLRKKEAAIKAQRAEAQADVERAERRLQQVDEELAAFEDSTE
jgi:hypothetical protein